MRESFRSIADLKQQAQVRYDLFEIIARKGLAGIGMVCFHVTTGNTETTETRYAITSLKDVATFAHAMRTHWSIENGLHYCLDVSFNEDHSRIRKDHAPENLALVRHFALSALKQLSSPKRASIKRKRKNMCLRS